MADRPPRREAADKSVRETVGVLEYEKSDDEYTPPKPRRKKKPAAVPEVPINVVVRRQGAMGKGLLTLDPIQKGQIVGVYSGDNVLTKKEYQAFLAANPQFNRGMQETTNRFVLGDGSTNNVDCINFACPCVANVEFVKAATKDSTGRRRIIVRALEDIPGNTWLGSYYGSDYEWNPRKRDSTDPHLQWLLDYRCPVCYPDNTDNDNELHANRMLQPAVVAVLMTDQSDDEAEDAVVAFLKTNESGDEAEEGEEAEEDEAEEEGEETETEDEEGGHDVVAGTPADKGPSPRRGTPSPAASGGGGKVGSGGGSPIMTQREYYDKCRGHLASLRSKGVFRDMAYLDGVLPPPPPRRQSSSSASAGPDTTPAAAAAAAVAAVARAMRAASASGADASTLATLAEEWAEKYANLV